MPEKRKVFRIEQMSMTPADVNAFGEQEGASHYQEILTELRALRTLLEGHGSQGASAPSDERTQEQVGEARKFKIELDVIGRAIQQTKHEFIALQGEGFDGARLARMAHQLDAVVNGTEQATGTILKSAEEIDQMAATLAASLKGSHEQGIAQDIQEQATLIFEACNFHDLTGQRISKVSATMKLVEDHIARMTDIWNVLDAAQCKIAANEADLLNGPKLDGDTGHSSQDDIDALFH